MVREADYARCMCKAKGVGRVSGSVLRGKGWLAVAKPAKRSVCLCLVFSRVNVHTQPKCCISGPKKGSTSVRPVAGRIVYSRCVRASVAGMAGEEFDPCTMQKPQGVWGELRELRVDQVFGQRWQGRGRVINPARSSVSV